MLWMFQRVYYGPITNEENRHLPDLSVREWATIGPLCAMAIFMGVFPNVFLKPMEPAITRLAQRLEGRQPMRVEQVWQQFLATPAEAPHAAPPAGEGN
jgi:NADH-quinone oxidoreductase subunit M